MAIPRISRRIFVIFALTGALTVSMSGTSFATPKLECEKMQHFEICRSDGGKSEVCCALVDGNMQSNGVCIFQSDLPVKIEGSKTLAVAPNNINVLAPE